VPRGPAYYVVAAFGLALLTPACHLIYPFSVERTEDAAAGDASSDQTALLDLPWRDLITDAAQREGAAADQAAGPPCVKNPDNHTLALYTFDNLASPMLDATGKHNGSVDGKPLSEKSQVGCGWALAFPAVPGPTASDYGVIPQHKDWDTVKSVDLWFRFDSTTPAQAAALLSRDANMTTMPGHLALYRLCNDAVYLRLQHAKGEIELCTKPTSKGIWHHVGVNLGQPGVELIVDGAPASASAGVTCGSHTFNCGVPGAADITGNANPWAVGASSSTSSEGKLDTVINQLHGAVDSLRISKVRRTFTNNP
jgi:hypothetical protein